MLIDEFGSLRELLKRDSSLYLVYGHLLTTDLLKDILPNVHKEYGSRPCDVQMTMSHNFISKLKPSVKPSGITIDARIGIKINLNFLLKFLVTTEEGKVEEARSMHISYA